MTKYSGKKQNFLTLWLLFNALVLGGAGLYVLRGHQWPSATYLIVFNIIYTAWLLNQNQLLTVMILEDQGLVRLEVERWIKIRETLEFSTNEIEAVFEISSNAKIFMHRKVFRIYVDGEKLLEVTPGKKGWPEETLQQIIDDLDKIKQQS